MGKNWGRRAGALLASLAMVSGFVAVTESPAAAVAAPCALAPTDAQLNVMQGVGGYTVLARAKTTLAKVFLKLPACATSVLVTSGGLDFTVDTDPLGGTRHVDLLAPPQGGYPKITKSTFVMNQVSTGDPRFVITGDKLAPSASIAKFKASMTATVNYTYTDPAGQTGTGSIQKQATVAFDQKLNTLRVLFVRLADTNKPTSGQWSAASEDAVSKAKGVLGRILPLADGISPLGGTDSSGLRATVSDGFLNIGGTPGSLTDTTLLRPDGKFCADDNSFSKLKAKLADRLSTWNSDNKTAQADRIVGVIDPNVSLGYNTTPQCAEGYGGIAGVGGGATQAYVRAEPSPVTGPSAGAILAMEMSHTFGLSRLSATYHSGNTTADTTSPNLAYNLTSKDFLPTNRSALKFSDTQWNDADVLLEPADWDYARCALGGSNAADCVSTGTSGSVSGAGAPGDRITIGGQARLPVGGATIQIESTDSQITNTTDSTAEPKPNGTTRLHLVQTTSANPDCGKGTNPACLKDTDIPLQADSAHTDATHDADHDITNAPEPFYVEYDVALGATVFQIRDGHDRSLTASDDTVWERTKQAQAPTAPVVSQPTTNDPYSMTQPARYTNNPAADTQPAISGPGTGQWVAWSRGNELFAAPTGNVGLAVTVPHGVQDVNWSPIGESFSRDGKALTFVSAGNIYEVPVSLDTATGKANIGARTTVYTAPGGGQVNLVNAKDPSFSPSTNDSTSNQYVVASIGGDLYVFNSGASGLPNTLPTCPISGAQNCRQLTTPPTPTSSNDFTEPDWAPTGQTVFAASHGNIVTVQANVNGPQPSPTFLAGSTNGLGTLSSPSVSADSGSLRLAFTTGSNLWIADASGPTTAAGLQQLTFLGSDSHVSLAWSGSNGQLVWQRSLFAPNDTDAMIASVSTTNCTPATCLGNTYNVTSSSTTPDLLAARGSVRCTIAGGDQRYYSFDNTEPPVDVNGQTATFRFHYDANSTIRAPLTCTGGRLIFGVNDGTQSASTDGGDASTGVDKPPIVTIDAPIQNQSFAAPGLVALSAQGSDPEEQPISYSWSVTRSENNSTQTFSGRTVDLTAASGHYTATVTASTTSPSASATATVNFVVKQLPTANIAKPTSGQSFGAGAAVTLDATGSTDGQPSEGPLTYNWYVTPQSGGATQQYSGSPVTVSSLAGGKYTLVLNVTDSDGNVVQAQTTFSVAASVPCTFSPSPELEVPSSQTTVSFTCTSALFDGFTTPADARITQIVNNGKTYNATSDPTAFAGFTFTAYSHPPGKAAVVTFDRKKLTDFMILKRFPDDSTVMLTLTVTPPSSSSSPVLVGTGTTKWDDDRGH